MPKALDEYVTKSHIPLSAQSSPSFLGNKQFLSRCQGCKPFQAYKNEGDCLDVARYSTVRELRTLERVFRSCQSLAHRTPTGMLYSSSQIFEKRERLNECSDPVRVLRSERGLEIVCPQNEVKHLDHSSFRLGNQNFGEEHHLPCRRRSTIRPRASRSSSHRDERWDGCRVWHAQSRVLVDESGTESGSVVSPIPVLSRSSFFSVGSKVGRGAKLACVEAQKKGHRP